MNITVDRKEISVGHHWGDADVTQYKTSVYPDPPALFWPISQVRRLPSGPVVYFVMDESWRLKYIGSTVRLRQRLLTHHAVSKNDFVSWMMFARKDYKFAESYYIGLLRPYANGEGR